DHPEVTRNTTGDDVVANNNYMLLWILTDNGYPRQRTASSRSRSPDILPIDERCGHCRRDSVIASTKVESGRSDVEILAMFEKAFRPLRCTAEIEEAKHLLRFTVSSPDGAWPLEADELRLRMLREGRLLLDVITIARERLQARGYKLDP